MNAREALKAANDRQMSLEPDPSNHKRELRQAYRNGYAEHRKQTQRLLIDMVAELDPERTFPVDAGAAERGSSRAHYAGCPHDRCMRDDCYSRCMNIE